MTDKDPHHHAHGHMSDLPSDPALRVMTLESLLVERGLVDPKALAALIDRYEHKTGPHNGARVVARAWVDPAYRERLCRDATAAISELGFSGQQGEHMVVVDNGPKMHNLVVCTLCSCYPWPVLGLPPAWYKSGAYRSRAVMDPRGVLAEFGLHLEDNVEVRVWDSTAEIRYLVLPERPPGSDDLGEEELAALVTRELHDWGGEGEAPPSAEDFGVNGPHDMGGMDGFGPVQIDEREQPFDHPWEARAFAHLLACGALGRWNNDAVRSHFENFSPPEYFTMRYFERWNAGLIGLLIDVRLVTKEEIIRGKPDPTASPAPPPLREQDVPAMIAAGEPYNRTISRAPIFADSARVRARNINPGTHTRLPRYVRGKRGVIDRHHGAFVFPDTNAEMLGEHPQHLYSVRFEAGELWGDRADARAPVYVDVWEEHLEPE